MVSLSSVYHEVSSECGGGCNYIPSLHIYFLTREIISVGAEGRLMISLKILLAHKSQLIIVTVEND